MKYRPDSFSPPSETPSPVTKAMKADQRGKDVILQTDVTEREQSNNDSSGSTPIDSDEEITFEGQRFHYIDSLTAFSSTVVPFDANEMMSMATDSDEHVLSEVSSPRPARQMRHLGEEQRYLEDSFTDEKRTNVLSEFNNEFNPTWYGTYHGLTTGNLTPSSSSSSLYDIVGYPDAPIAPKEDRLGWGGNVPLQDVQCSATQEEKRCMFDGSVAPLMFFEPTLEEKDGQDLDCLLEAMMQ